MRHLDLQYSGHLLCITHQQIFDRDCCFEGERTISAPRWRAYGLHVTNKNGICPRNLFLERQGMRGRHAA
jgi:hypothetical protein